MKPIFEKVKSNFPQIIFSIRLTLNPATGFTRRTYDKKNVVATISIFKGFKGKQEKTSPFCGVWP